VLWRDEPTEMEQRTMWYVLVAIGLIGLGVVLFYTRYRNLPRAITSLADAERLVNYHVGIANHRLRREAWMLTFAVSTLNLEKRTVSVRLGINYGRRGYPDYMGRFGQMWANARIMLQAKEKIKVAFAKRAFQADVETFT
jgi:hypothetical protein